MRAAGLLPMPLDLLSRIYRRIRRDLRRTWPLRVRRRRKLQRTWHERWSDDSQSAAWRHQTLPQEVVDAVRDGWFPAGSRVLDIGCGNGIIAEWMAGQGFPTIAIDIAPAAIERARARFPEEPGRLEFRVVDICGGLPPGGPFQALIDCRCLHQIPSDDHAAYRQSVLRVSAPDARMLLFHRAFRADCPPDDPDEWQRITRVVERALGSAFAIVRTDLTWFDRYYGQTSDIPRPGLVFRLERRR